MRKIFSSQIAKDSEKHISIALVGQPNTGKSTLFGQLTGVKQHVGNWAGKTVEGSSGYFDYHNVRYDITDLPGIYSLSVNSREEIITKDFLFSSSCSQVLIILIDASQLERSMYLLADFVGIQIPVVLVITMTDIAEKKGEKIQYQKLAERLNVPVIPIVGTQKTRMPSFLDEFEKAIKMSKMLDLQLLQSKYCEHFKEDLEDLQHLLPANGIGKYSCEWLTERLLEHDQYIIDLIQNNLDSATYSNIQNIISKNQNGAIIGANCKYEWINDILLPVIAETSSLRKIGRFDKIATHPVWGIPLALAIILLSFIISILGSEIFNWIIAPINNARLILKHSLMQNGITQFSAAMLTDAVVPGFLLGCFMLCFVSCINVFIGIIEDTGYMARIAYIFDTAMGKIGLQGKSIMPFIMSFGCTVGGVTAARTIDSKGQRLLTIATSWVLPCSAIWGVIGFISSFFFGVQAVWIICGMFLVAVLHMKITSLVFRNSSVDEECRLIMELPPYHSPNWRTIFTGVLERVKVIVSKSFPIIILTSVGVWLLSYTSDGNIQKSYIYAIGKFLEPVGSFCGLNWQFLIVLIISIIGKEAALGAIAILCSSHINSTGMLLQNTLLNNPLEIQHAILASVQPAQALAFLFAFFFNTPCIAAIVATVIESQSSWWTFKLCGYYIGMALLIACGVYHAALCFG